jgi:RHS repeat-associated protein
VTAGVQLAPSLHETTQTLRDAFGNPTETIDPLLFKTDEAFDKDDEPIAEDDAAGTADDEHSSQGYDTLGEQTISVDALGDVTQTAHDSLGRVVGTVVASGTTAAQPQLDFYNRDSELTGTLVGSGADTGLTTIAYNPFGQQQLVTDPDGHQVESLYDSAGRQTGTIDAPGTADPSTETVALDGFSEAVATTDGDGRTRGRLLDNDGEVTATVSPRGGLGATLDDEFGRETLSIDPLGRQTATFYDDDGEVTLVAVGFGTADETRTYTTYDDFGRVSTTADGDGRTQASFYDGDGRVTLSVNGYGGDNPERTSTSYDENGNPTVVTDGLGHATHSTFDHLNRATAVTDASGRTSHNYFDAAGNLTGTADGLAHLTRHLFDHRGREVATFDPDNHETDSFLDLDGNLTGLLDADNNLTTFAFDAQGRQTGSTDPLGHTSHAYFDDAGQLTLSVDRLGRKIGREYDADGNLTAEVWTDQFGSPAGGRTFTYDLADEQRTASNAAGTDTLSYDNAGRVSEVDGPFGVSLSFGFDGGGNRTSAADSSGGRVTSVFDDEGRLSTRALGIDGTDYQFGNSYDAAGRLVGVTRMVRPPHGVGLYAGSTESDYDAGGLVTGIVHTAAHGVVLGDDAYQYDLAGRLTVQVDGVAGVTTGYTYDAAGQLTADGSTPLSYDATGNRTGGSYTTGPDNRIGTDGLWTYTFDAAGELVAKTDAAGDAWVYRYDVAGELTHAELTPAGWSQPTVSVDYGYDAWGNLVGRTEHHAEYDGDTGTWATVTVSDERFVVDGWDTAKASPTGIENFDDYAVLVPDGGGGWQVASRTAFGAGFDEPVVAMSSATGVSWYGADRQGSVRLVFDNSGTVLAAARYDAFGNVVSGGVVGSFDLGYGYAGLRMDPATGHYRTADPTRQYDPTVGRFLSEDPMGFAAGDSNLDRYVGNGPTNATDPSGQQLIAVGEQGKKDAIEHLQRLGVAADSKPLGEGSKTIWENPSGDQIYLITPDEKWRALPPGNTFNDWILEAFGNPNVHRFVGHLGGRSTTPEGKPWPGRVANYVQLDPLYIGTGLSTQQLAGLLTDAQMRVVGDFTAAARPAAPPGGAAPPSGFRHRNDSFIDWLSPNAAAKLAARGASAFTYEIGDTFTAIGCPVIGDAYTTVGNLFGVAEQVFDMTSPTAGGAYRSAEMGLGLLDRAGDGYTLMRGSGNDRVASATAGALLVPADLSGVSMLSDAWDGRDLLTGRPLSRSDRWTGGAVGTYQLITAGRGSGKLVAGSRGPGGSARANSLSLSDRLRLLWADDSGAVAVAPGGRQEILTIRLEGYKSLAFDESVPASFRAAARRGIDETKRELASLAPGAQAAPAVRRVQLGSVDEQAKFLSENVPDLTQEQAKLLLTEAQSRGSSVVIGGSRIRGNHGPNSDLDVGYGSLSSNQAKKVNEKVSKLGPLKLEETRIVPGYESEVIPKITTPEEFFQRSGVRGPKDPKPGQPYVPSGSITVTPQGEVIIIPPGATPP